MLTQKIFGIKSNFLETSINGAQTNLITVIIKSTRNFFFGVRGILLPKKR